MRTQLLKIGDGGSVLTVTPGWREHVLLEPLKWIEEQESPLLAHVRIEARGDKVKALHYSFPNGTSIADILSKPLPPALYQFILGSVAEAAALCVLAGRQVLLYADENSIFISSNGVLRFAYVPIESNGARRHIGLRPVLKTLVNKKIDFENTDDERCKKELALFLESGEPKDFYTFALFLRDNLMLSLQEMATKALADEEARKRAESDEQMRKAAQERSLSGAGQQGGGAKWRGVSVQGSYKSFEFDEQGASDSYENREDVLTIQPTSVIAIKRLSTGDISVIPAGGGFIGRTAKCVVRVLNNPKIGREHATIFLDGNDVILSDNNSHNGTRVGGRCILGDESARIAVGESFSLADEEFVVVRTDVFHMG